METLSKLFKTKKADIIDAWENPLRPNSRITRDWIYSCDPETMEYVKIIWPIMPGEYSIYDTFVAIMKSKSFESLIRKSKLK